jgi:GNAT superfamily N-acetyltransferase
MTNSTPVRMARPADAVAVLCDAFRDYPVMRYVLGPADDFDRRLERLIGFFVAARADREEPVLGIADAEALVAVALVTPPASGPAPDALAARRDVVWAELGADARRRYDTYGAAAGQFAVPGPHHHLNMIGVRRSHLGRGLARTLIDAVHNLAQAHPSSEGVSLTTETASNVALYEHFGYRVRGRARVADGLDTWMMFRPAERR